MVQNDSNEGEEQAKIKKAVYRRLKEMQVEQQKKEIAKRFLTPQAYERLMNVRVANAELYSQLIDLIISMARTNRISDRLTEEQLKGILAKMTYRPEPTIEFKHK